MVVIQELPSPTPISKQLISSCLINKLKPTCEIFAEVKMLVADIILFVIVDHSKVKMFINQPTNAEDFSNYVFVLYSMESIRFAFLFQSIILCSRLEVIILFPCLFHERPHK